MLGSLILPPFGEGEEPDLAFAGVRDGDCRGEDPFGDVPRPLLLDGVRLFGRPRSPRGVTGAASFPPPPLGLLCDLLHSFPYLHIPFAKNAQGSFGPEGLRLAAPGAALPCLGGRSAVA